jgi:hypothetical protein
MQNAIVMPHGAVLFCVQNVAKRLEPRRINAMHYVYKNKPDSRGLDPPIQGNKYRSLPWMARIRVFRCRSRAMRRKSAMVRRGMDNLNPKRL